MNGTAYGSRRSNHNASALVAAALGMFPGNMKPKKFVLETPAKTAHGRHLGTIGSTIAAAVQTLRTVVLLLVALRPISKQLFSVFAKCDSWLQTVQISIRTIAFEKMYSNCGSRQALTSTPHFVKVTFSLHRRRSSQWGDQLATLITRQCRVRLGQLIHRLELCARATTRPRYNNLYQCWVAVFAESGNRF